MCPARPYDLREGWARERGFEIVPAESAARLPVGDIPRLASALAAFASAVAVDTDMPLGAADAFEIQICTGELRELNRRMGVNRVVVINDDGEWVISCNEWYNLFAARPSLLESMLGKSISQARSEFDLFARRHGGLLPGISAHYNRPG